MMNKNVVLIGMPGAGKSTVGRLLAKALEMPFIDTDKLIRDREKSSLQELINKKGIDEFLRIEEEVILGLKAENHIVATGGSAVYSEAAINHLKSGGIVVFLDAKPYQLARRIKNAEKRGIAMKNGQTLEGLYRERLPLYRKYADIEINCSGKHINAIVSEIIGFLRHSSG
ncbi:MAG: shikimate kinase [Acetivibrionales bacterium]|jgi:shikimate kinase